MLVRSEVTMMKGVLLNRSSARTCFNKSIPLIVGIFQSQKITPTGGLVELTKLFQASSPLAACQNRLNPKSVSCFTISFRVVIESSTIRKRVSAGNIWFWTPSYVGRLYE